MKGTLRLLLPALADSLPPFGGTVPQQTGVNIHYDRSVPMPGPPDAYWLSFVKKRERRYAAWTTTAAPEAAVLPVPPGKYTLYDLMGHAEKQVVVDKSGLPVTLTGDVQFVVLGDLKDTK